MFSLRLSSSAAVGPTPSFVGCASSLAEGRPVSALEPAVEAMGPVAALEPAVEAMERPVAALEPAVEAMGPVAALEPAVEAMGRPVSALEPAVEAMGPVGMQPCLPLHCHRPQHCDQVVNG